MLAIKYDFSTLRVMHKYEVQSRKDPRRVNLVSDALPFEVVKKS